jgi:DNA ligase (NAD+)
MVYSATNSEVSAKIDQLGFTSVDNVIVQTLDGAKYTTISTNISQLLATIEEFGRIRRANLLNIPTDGVVIKCVDDFHISALMGATEHHPSSQIAYKYEGETMESIIEDIEISVGRTGRLSVRAKIAEVVIDGIRINYATLHNFTWIEERGIRIGAKILITRANDVIPYVQAVVSVPKDSAPFIAPEVCPLCQAEIDKRTLLWRCPNDNCESRGIRAFEFAVKRNFLNIEYMSTKMIEALEYAGKLSDLSDLFYLSIDDIANTPYIDRIDENGEEKNAVRLNKNGEPQVFGETTATKVYDAIQSAKEVGLARLLASLNIPLVQRATARDLARVFPDIFALQAATLEELCTIDGIAERTADCLVEGLLRRAKTIERMVDAGVDFTSREYSTVLEKGGVSVSGAGNENLPLAGQQIVISGNLEGYNRIDARDAIEELGATTSGSVSKNTTLLIADRDSVTSKVTKAKQLGVGIISPEEFRIQYLEGNVSTQPTTHAPLDLFTI